MNMPSWIMLLADISGHPSNISLRGPDGSVSNCWISSEAWNAAGNVPITNTTPIASGANTIERCCHSSRRIDHNRIRHWEN